MVNKIVDVPDNATNVDFKYVKATVLSDYVVGHQTLSVYKMPDAPEKRVIELPDDVIDYLVKTKRLVSINNVLDFLSVLDDNPKVFQCVSIDEVAEWYLGHVEFVSKKESKFIVFVEFGFKTNLVEVVNFKKTGKRVIKFLETSDWEALVEESLEDEGVGDLPAMTESEAYKVIAGLGGENGLLKARKVKVED